jgi:c-di-GMP-binding flagellar brake protein YcgR
LECFTMDKRREKRIIERDAVFIKSADEHKDTTYGVGITAYTYDLSLGGARIFSEKFFAVGTVIRIVIELARTNQSVQIDGEVKWARERDDEGLYEMGVEFLHNISQTSSL